MLLTRCPLQEVFPPTVRRHAIRHDVRRCCSVELYPLRHTSGPSLAVQEWVLHVDVALLDDTDVAFRGTHAVAVARGVGAEVIEETVGSDLPNANPWSVCYSAER